MDSNNVKVWHNPRCGKSREAVKTLEELHIDAEVIKYLDTSLDVNKIKSILKMLGISARELMRTTEAIYKELNLKNEEDEEKLIEAMVQNPKLIQRPIVIKGSKAIIARPASLIADFLNA